MPSEPLKKQLEKTKDATKEGAHGGYVKEEPSTSDGKGGMIGEGENKGGAEGGMQGER